jgi:hypothetical protein
MKMRPKVSIDSIDRYYRYRSIVPSPIVPIYVSYFLSFDEERGEDTHGEMGAKVASDRQLRFTNDK